jgi:hypothetical protein
MVDISDDTKIVRQMPVAHQTLAAVIGELVGMAAEQGGYFGLDRLRQQPRMHPPTCRSGVIADNVINIGHAMEKQSHT